MIGKLLGNRYEILEQLGGGGMAIIYKGRDTFLNRLVTIKVLRPEFTSDEDFVKRFRREAQAVASLSHPNIVSIYDVGREEEIHYLVMEYVEGDNLKNLIRAEGVLPPEQAAEIALQVSDALQHAHDNNIVHRDVKPQNILITRGGRAKLTDFGIARGATAATLTQTDTIVGSVHYLSPEQARGETAGPRSDLYSLGVVLYEMVTGALPFMGDTPIAVALKHIQEEPARPSGINPAVSPGLEKIIARAMAKAPAERPASAREMAAELQKFSLPGSAPMVNAPVPDEFATRVIPAVSPAPEISQPPEIIRGEKKKRPWWFWTAAALLGLLVFGAGAFQLYMNVPVVKMPSVEGKTIDEAKRILQKEGFKNIVENRSTHPTVTLGRVISQDPQPETEVRVTRNVILVISNGPDPRDVPNVVGLLLSEAKIKISQHELNVKEPVQEKYSNDFAAGVVMEQDPKAGERLAKGSGVILVLSKGPEPQNRQVPDLTGLTLDKAREELEKVKLRLSENITRYSSQDYPAGYVISQDPARGSEVLEGSEVRVVISSGPGPSRRMARIVARTPDDGKEHELRIVVNDVTGSKEVHIDVYGPDERVVKEVPYYGKAKIQVFIDGKVAGEERFD